MRAVIGIGLALLAAVFQATFNPQVRLFGGEPNFVLLLTLAWAARTPLAETILIAFAGGIGLDLMSAGPLGLTTLALLPAIFAIDIVREQLVGFNYLLLVLFTAIASFVYALIMLAGMVIAGFALPPLSLLSYTILPTAVYNLALLTPVFVVVRWLTREPKARS
jgi:rod shape-determining protein MreD